jgi:thioredoxin reductase/ferredoxin
VTPTPPLESTLIWALAALIATAVVLPYVVAFRRRRRADRERLAEARALGIDRPVAQYPFVDPISCIGCGACVRACPEGDVLGVVGGVAVVINGLRCVGHGRCADACPVGAIEIGLGDLKGRPDVPLLTAEQESTLRGVFVAGELSGLALIRNAIQQGSTVARTVAQRARRCTNEPAAVDLLVVGAGPAGIAAALAAREEGLRAVVVEQAESLGGTILHFPRRKMVLTQPVPLPGGDALAREEYSKEELLSLLGERIAARRLDVRFGERLEAIRGGEGAFEVATSAAIHRARYVVLALGRRGTPRKLGVPGEERGKVMYQLRDAETYKRQRILVVGGGDSAIEAAVGLARQAGNDVTLSYRKSAFHRVKQKNQATIDSMRQKGKLRVAFASEVVEIEEDRVRLRTGNETENLGNDYVFVFIGGDPPYRFLESLGVHFGGSREPQPASASRAGAAAALALASALAGLPLAAQESPHGELATTCETCHTTADWKVVRQDVTFDHTTTGFQLAGVHARLDCSQCHADKVFSRVGTACADCHRDDHRGELGIECTSCHDPNRWDARTDFRTAHARTLFPLVGGHARADCDACHTAAPPRQYSNVPTDCIACHRGDFVAAHTPAHSGAPSDCRVCHRNAAESWSRVAFEHPARFPLSGGHATLTCADCHRGPANAVSPDCYSCHRADYEATRDPNHVAAALPTQCVACHSTAGWNTAVFDHFTSGFPLEGLHRTTPCGSCHAQGYAGTPRDCVSCHRADYDSTAEPNHAAAGFPTTCASCHSPSGWFGASFNHDSAFALTGAHRAAACESCHRAGYTGTPRDCASCHRADYDATTDPNHVAAGFPTTCQNCHDTNAWAGASFDHATTAFPLTGAHLAAACDSCHSSGYAGTPRDCASCHIADYNATTNPNHASAGFPTTCQGCHNTNSWLGASFDHDASFFPIYSGNHRGTWASCSTCHVVAGNYAVFECTVCHEHNRTTTDNDHDEVSGYSYNSNACLSCHPDGDE